MTSVAQRFSFKEILENLANGYFPPHLDCVVGIDPGETTGIAIFLDGELEGTHQVDHRGHKNVGRALEEIIEAINCENITTVVVEDYRVYKNKAQSHTHSDLFTSRLIGAIETWTHINKIPLVKQMASQAKKFMTDSKLKAWGFWIIGKRHSRDAIRHAATYILFEVRKTKG